MRVPEERLRGGRISSLDFKI